MSESLPFEKKELTINVHNPNHLPTIDFHELKELQGDLKITTPAKIEKLKNSIIKYGVFVPKFTWIDNGTHYIEDGHQTIKALTELEKGGYDVPPIPYVEIQAKDRKDAAEKLLMIDSRFADINPETSFFKDFDIGLEFMEEIEIPELELNFEGVDEEIVEDEVPPVPEEPVTRVDDLWLLGKHRVLCGDATKVEAVERLMDGKKAQLCFTSPPYWVGKDYEKETTLEEVKDFIKNIASSITHAVTKDGGRIVINTSTARAQAINPKAEVETLFSLSWWQDAFRDKDWLMRHCRLWVKSGQLAAKSISPKSDVIDQHWETLATFLPTFYNPDGLRRGQERIKMKWAQQGVWNDIKGTANMNEHGAAFPVELPHRYIRLYSTTVERILDPFLGSGTTLIAAQQLNRISYGMEIEPKYVDVICQRFFNLTGIDPIRESDGKKWSEFQQQKLDKT